MAKSNMHCRGLIVALAAVTMLLAACGSDAGEQAQVAAALPVATTAPLSVPTPTPVPTPTTVPQATAIPLSTPLPTAEPAPQPTSTAAPAAPPTPEPAPTLEPAPNPTAAFDAAPAVDAQPATEVAEVIETPTPLPAATAQEPTSEEPASEEPTAAQDGANPDAGSGSEAGLDPAATPVPETPTAVVAASGEAPLECYDTEVQIYRAFVDGVDDLSFEGGRVYCSGAGTNSVSATGSYRHSSGLVVQRNGDFILDETGAAYIPYSGAVHFCVNGQPASAPVRAETVPGLLVVIDAEAQRQLSLGASAPAAFTASGTQC